jgi:cytochrome c
MVACWTLGVAVVFSGLVQAQDTAVNRAGEKIYRQQCARCHGPAGEGDDEFYPQPLAGDRGLEELARYIAKTMPEDKPEKVSREDAERVAAYIYDAFYSKVARNRNLPVRIELARLTVRQHRNAIADLINGVRAPAPERRKEQ